MAELPLYREDIGRELVPWDGVDYIVLLFGVFSVAVLSGLSVGLGIVADDCMHGGDRFSNLCEKGNGSDYVVGSAGSAAAAVAIVIFTKYALNR